MNRFLLVAALALAAFPGRAHADVPPYQPTEDACTSLAQGAACNVNLDFDNYNTQGQGYADGGSGSCQAGGTCTIEVTLSLLPDGGSPSNPDAGINCVEGTKCYEQVACLQCVPSSAPSSSSTGGSTGTSGSSGGCSSAAAVGPWILALLIPVLVRRKKSA